LTVVQVARELGVTEGAVRDAIRRGAMHSEEALGRKVILRTEIEAYRKKTQFDGEKRRGRPPKAASGTAEARSSVMDQHTDSGVGAPRYSTADYERYIQKAKGDWEIEFIRESSSRPSGLTPLPDEATRRESMYGDDGR
jgi:hypothetical protein